MTKSVPSLPITCLLGLLTGLAPLTVSAHDAATQSNAPAGHEPLILAQIPAPDITPLPPIYDPADERPSLTDRVNDTFLAARVRSALSSHPELNDADIDVDTEDGIVTLTGNARSEAAKARAVDVAGDVDGVKAVYGEYIRVE